MKTASLASIVNFFQLHQEWNVYSTQEERELSAATTCVVMKVFCSNGWEWKIRRETETRGRLGKRRVMRKKAKEEQKTGMRIWTRPCASLRWWFFFHISIISSFFSPAKRRRHRQESKELLAKARSALYGLSEQKQIFSSQVTFVHELQYSGEVILWAIFTLWLDACSDFNPLTVGEKQRTPSSLWDNSQ